MKGSHSILACACAVILLSLLGGSIAYMGCPDVDPMNHTVHLPHPNCTLFYRCDHGYPKLDYCPPGLHFNPMLQVCDWPDQAGCKNKTSCLPLSNSDSSYWMPQSCTEQYGEVNDLCNIECVEGFEHSGGNTVQCRSDGWYGQQGANQLPTCFLTTDLGDLIVDQINETLNGNPANLLFLMDESGSVATLEFDLEIRFTKALISAFPLSGIRAGGAITFDSSANVDIPLSTDDTCSFFRQADLIRYSGGGTDILTALNLAIKEIQLNGVHNRTIVFLITDGQSADASSAANTLKGNGDILFTVGVAGYSPQQLIPLASLDSRGDPLFFGIDSFEIFEKVAEYLETTYNTDGIDCNSSTTSTSSTPKLPTPSSTPPRTGGAFVG